MKKSLQTIFFLAMFAVTAFAMPSNDAPTKTESKVYQGYVVLTNGTKLEGKIEMISPTLNEVKVKFIAPDGTTAVYRAKEVESYAFIFPAYNAETRNYQDQWITYVKKDVAVSPVPFGPTNVLIERQVSGSINLYNHYVERRETSHGYDHSYYIEKNGEMVEVNRENFKNVMKDAVANYPELMAKIGTPDYGYKYIAKIVAEYNAQIGEKSAN